MKNISLILITVLFSAVSCTGNEPVENKEAELGSTSNKLSTMSSGMDTITLGAGCFWCVEAIFESINGVESAVSGYSGGAVKNPSYKEVCAGTTGHAEVVQVIYDPAVVSLTQILEVFFQTHDPTTLNRQGGDVGTQYRSAVFYHNDNQKVEAETIIAKLNEAGAFDDPIVTEVTAFSNFYPAEDYHQSYFELNGNQPYCRAVINPKVEKFKKTFKELLK